MARLSPTFAWNFNFAEFNESLKNKTNFSSFQNNTKTVSKLEQQILLFPQTNTINFIIPE